MTDGLDDGERVALCAGAILASGFLGFMGGLVVAWVWGCP